MGWHAGPAAFISRTRITVFSGFTAPGVHSRCFNSTHIGIEMVGDYNAEPFDTGDGALVRDNAVFAMATLYRALGLSPADLKFHVDCKLDNHDCPGRNVVKGDMIGRVAMLLSGWHLPAQPAPPTPVASGVDVLALQTKLAALGFYKGGLDGDRGPKTNAALQDFAISTLTKEGK